MRSCFFIPVAVVLATLPSCVISEPVHEGYVESSGTGAEIIVHMAPPPPREEAIIGVAPSPSHVWVGGYWTRHHSSWYWVRGSWVVRPRPAVTWTPGHWDRHPRGWVWVSGGW